VGALDGRTWPDLLGAADDDPALPIVAVTFEEEPPMWPPFSFEEDSLFWKPLLDVTTWDGCGCWLDDTILIGPFLKEFIMFLAG
jgi:hypothetical protein